MQQSAPTDYAAQLSAVKTLPELFDFRAKLKSFLKAEIEDYFGDVTCKNPEPERVQAERISELEFFIARVESQIKSLESKGMFLAAVDGRGAVGTLDLTLEKAEAETLVENSAGVIAEAGLSPIEKLAESKGVLEKLKKLQSVLKEGHWGCAGDDSFKSLWYDDIITKADWGLGADLGLGEDRKNVYLWRHDMDYVNFLVKNQPKN